MQVLDVFRPDQWHDFFITVGGGAAALTGLVFVAMSLKVTMIAQDPTHRYRAIGTLTGFTAAFVVCSLAVMGGQDHRAVGIEWLVVATVAGAVYVYGYVQAIRVGESSVGLRMIRLVFGTGCYVSEAVGAALLVAGQIAGLYVAAVAMIPSASELRTANDGEPPRIAIAVRPWALPTSRPPLPEGFRPS